MDGSSNKRYPAVRRERLPAKAVYSGIGLSGIGTQVYTEPLIIDPAALAPLPPDGRPDNLLRASTKNEVIVVTAPLPLNADAGDTVQVSLNGTLVGTPLDVEAFLDDEIMRISISAKDRATVPEGVVRINYQIAFVSGSGGVEPGPDGQTYITDYTAPGLPFLGQLVFSDEVVKNGVTPAALSRDADGNEYLAARVPSYRDLAPGDIVVGLVDSRSEVLDPINVGGTDIELRFMRSFIEEQADGSMAFSYSVSDRAGNNSLPSRPVILEVLLEGAISDLEAPRVPAYDDDPLGEQIIDEEDARAAGGVTVEIPANTGILVGDTVLLHWGSQEIGPVRVSSTGNDPVVTIGVPYAALLAEWGAKSAGQDAAATVDVGYDVLRGNLVAGSAQTPAVVEVNLYQAGGVDPDPETPENESLEAPTLTSAGGSDNEIPPEDAEKNATITIPWLQADGETPVFLIGDIVTPVYGTYDVPSLTIEAEPAEDLTISLPVVLIIAVGSGAIDLYYRVERTLAGGGSNTSRSPITVVTVHGADELPGGGSLPAGTMPEAVGTAPAQPDRLLIGKVEAKDGSDFVIPAYVNQRADDTVTVTMRVFRSFYSSGHPADRPSADNRDVTKSFTGPISPPMQLVVHLTEVELMRFDYPTQALHAHLTYTVTSAQAPDRPVTSDVLLVDLDPRGDLPG
ncbi:hypothetical protein [Luteibacter sp. ME-Dv--P-043b]|uniref:hypothetical protein n=1 Tax=Luteibacter sp. ME-Dv--P-043b TaxID=3040291 RepID=UPI0025525D7E|nr:hypothetical protein [Luteibacter sp. ME-Dv--P-043b]